MLSSSLPAGHALRPIVRHGVPMALALLLAFTFRDAIRILLDVWGTKEEYSFGYLIPFISLFMFWQKKDVLARTPFAGSWTGFAMVALGVAMLALGRVSLLATFMYYGFLLALLGLVLSNLGWRAASVVWGSLVVLAFMIPLPAYAFIELSQALQLLSSRVGVAVIRLFGISVYLEGNVIDLGTLKLQVVEACSGLRYLFPLMTLGFIAVYFYRAAAWKKAVVFLSTIPITIAMNSLRIGVIGVTVEYWGKSMAEGLLHDFEGWVIFMICTAILLGEMWLLSRPGGLPFGQVLSIELPSAGPAGATAPLRSPPRSFLAAIGLVVLAGAYTLVSSEREPVVPKREGFATFPMEMEGWRGRIDSLEKIFLDELKLDDYVLATYSREAGRPVNFYVSWYGAQIRGNAAHSPRACLPGDGWEILGFTQVSLAQIAPAHRVNRVLIRKGGSRMLVYYWFQGRGRTNTNEYLVKIDNLRDAIARNRSDGAMVRLVTAIDATEDEQSADARLQEFARAVDARLAPYVPS